MADAVQKRMTADEFLVWHLAQDGKKYELVDGIPVPHRSMAGAKNLHNRIAANVLGHLFGRLRASPCQPSGSDMAVRTSIDQVRYPEVTIDCAPTDRTSLEAVRPIAVFEVLSASTRTYDLQVKLLEYLRHPMLSTIALIDPDLMEVIVYSRDDKREWQIARLKKPEETLVVQGTDALLSLAEIYDRVPLTPTAAAPANS